MVDPNKPIQPVPPPEQLDRIQPIEGYGQKEKRELYGPRPDGAHVFAAIVSCLKSTFFFQKKKSKLIDKQEVIQSLQDFYNALQALIQADRSHDPSFTEMLSSLWHKINEDCNQLESSLGSDHPATVKLRVLIEEIDLYPPWEAHSLGFYLTKRAGADWIPIPFMEILFSLHIGAQKNPLQNTLEKWCHTTEDVLAALEEGDSNSSE